MLDILYRSIPSTLSNSLTKSMNFSPVDFPKSPILTPDMTISFAPSAAAFLASSTDIHINELMEHVKHIDGVLDMHHMHVWTIDGENHCATLHVIVEEINSKIKTEIKEEFHEHGITHVTIEMETTFENCQETNCQIKQSHHGCCHH